MESNVLFQRRWMRGRTDETAQTVFLLLLLALVSFYFLVNGGVFSNDQAFRYLSFDDELLTAQILVSDFFCSVSTL